MNFQCDNATQTCIPGQGNMTLKDCAQACTNHSQTVFGCDWSNATAPKCVEGKGSQSLADCAQNCHAVQYAKCNPQTGTCDACQPSDPGCQYTVDYCQASCQKSNIVGTWRGIQINKGFKVAEFDFSFYPDGNVAFVSTTNSSAVYEASYFEGGHSQEASPIIFVLNKVPDVGVLPLALHDNIHGLYLIHDGEEGITRFLSLGLGTSAQREADSFDQAMNLIEFVLVSCKSADHCDFSPAKVPE